MTEIKLVDVAAEARAVYGDRVNEVVGRKMPEREWRFELHLEDGRVATMHVGATADSVAAYLVYLKKLKESKG